MAKHLEKFNYFILTSTSNKLAAGSSTNVIDICRVMTAYNHCLASNKKHLVELTASDWTSH